MSRSPDEEAEGGYPPPVYQRDDKPIAEDAAQRIEDAREAARRKRRELGLPELPAEDLALPKRGKRAGKRSKKHGQFMQPDAD